MNPMAVVDIMREQALEMAAEKGIDPRTIQQNPELNRELSRRTRTAFAKAQAKKMRPKP